MNVDRFYPKGSSHLKNKAVRTALLKINQLDSCYTLDFYMLFLFPGQNAYERYTSTDCAEGHDLQWVFSNNAGHSNCVQLCNWRTDCAGFVVYLGYCFLKSFICENNTSHNSQVTLFLKPGNFKCFYYVN